MLPNHSALLNLMKDVHTMIANAPLTPAFTTLQGVPIEEIYGLVVAGKPSLHGTHPPDRVRLHDDKVRHQDQAIVVPN